MGGVKDELGAVQAAGHKGKALRAVGFAIHRERHFVNLAVLAEETAQLNF